MTPEQRAREKIDELLQAAGWVIRDKANFNRKAALGVAVREFQLPNGAADYLLFVDGRSAGVIEAKPAGTTLSGVADQSDKYMVSLPEHLARWADKLLFDCEAGLRDFQIGAVEGLEHALAKYQPRSLIEMATGAGKVAEVVAVHEEQDPVPLGVLDQPVTEGAGGQGDEVLVEEAQGVLRRSGGEADDEGVEAMALGPAGRCSSRWATPGQGARCHRHHSAQRVRVLLPQGHPIRDSSTYLSGRCTSRPARSSAPSWM